MVKFWRRQKVYADFRLHGGSGIPNPRVFRGQLYIVLLGKIEPPKKAAHSFPWEILNLPPKCPRSPKIMRHIPDIAAAGLLFPQ